VGTDCNVLSRRVDTTRQCSCPPCEFPLPLSDAHQHQGYCARTESTSLACLSVDAWVSIQTNFPSLNR
jgi:hypothetical protein